VKGPALATLLAAALVGAQVLPQDRLRTGMVEIGLRAWNVDRSSGSTDLVGISACRLVTDNASVGVLAADIDSGRLGEAVLVDVLARLYLLPLQSWTPWAELRGGGLLRPRRGSGASHLAGGIGMRWRPVPRLALDLQLAGFERWGYDDPSEGSNGTAEWLMQRDPLSGSGSRWWLLVPTPSIQVVF
jgi:hypothetical protein